MKTTVYFIVSLFTMLYCVDAQNTSRHEWRKTFEVLSLQGDMSLFMLNFEKAAITVSERIAFDVDIFRLIRTNGQASLGLHAGYGRVDWPDLDREEKYVNNYGYTAIDYDLLCRYTYLTRYFRYDLLTGLCVRNGEYYEGRMIDGEYVENAVQVSPGLKIGGEITLLLIKPVLALRLKGSMFLFGYKPIEAGAIGLGLVLGWQRDVEDD